MLAVVTVGSPAPVVAKMSCCGKSCPTAPKKAAKCCQIAPAQKKDVAALVRLPVVSHPKAFPIVMPLRHAAVVAVSAAVPPARVVDEAHSGLSPPVLLA